ncbi:hypothetical protein BN2476_1250008 [Paraburkholderia piptadeniae]|uniref:Uncharacterized protein n=1 Tax=Paraburkholderia piptadeniae TaxID=1701573 RepID=A0A1N7SW76_9BURK|nr:hypothetical protein BN2476_1250008 [Paraburkholderia piptadeniae]
MSAPARDCSEFSFDQSVMTWDVHVTTSNFLPDTRDNTPKRNNFASYLRDEENRSFAG